jgi:hypothetical protein
MARGAVGQNGLWRNPAFFTLGAGTLVVRMGAQVAVMALTWLILEWSGSGGQIG